MSFKDFTINPTVPFYLRKISKYENGLTKKFFEICDKIDNFSQFKSESSNIISEITGDLNKQSQISSEFNILKQLVRMMVAENIKNENVDEFFGESIDNNSDFSKYFKTQYDDVFIRKISDLSKMNIILNKHKFSILNLDYDINLRSNNSDSNEKLVPVISLHLIKKQLNMDADCSIRDIDYLIEELNKLKKKAKQLENIHDS